MKTHLLSLTPATFCDQTKACEEGRIYALKHKTMSDVWDNCPKLEWLLWMLDAIDAPKDDKNLRFFAVWCARNTPLADGRKTGDLLTDPRSLNALDVAERFAHGQATRGELDAARDAAWDALDAAWDAARAAAREARGEARGAAREAREAAWGASWAALAAARAAQSAQFKKMIANPFR